MQDGKDLNRDTNTSLTSTSNSMDLKIVPKKLRGIACGCSASAEDIGLNLRSRFREI